MLRGYKDIADRIKKVWGISVSIPSVIRWSRAVKDPLPLKRIRPEADGKRCIIRAMATDVDQWAMRRVA